MNENTHCIHKAGPSDTHSIQDLIENNPGSGEMSQWLTAFTALAEDLSSINFSSREIQRPLLPSKDTGTCMHIAIHTHNQK